jgi:hypothetical protein
MANTLDTHDTQDDTIEMSSSPKTSTPEKKMNKDSDMKTKTPMMIVIFLLAVLSGAGTGYGIHRLNAQGSRPSDPEIANIQEGSPTSDVAVGDVFGSPNEDTFKDSAEGVIQAGGLDGEGTHKLIRTGGISQTVYLTSSVVDLDKFNNAKVKVWGETNTAQKAGWLMDVGRIKVMELNAEIPEESKPIPTSTPKAGKDTKASPTSSKKSTPVDEEE